MHNMAVQWMQQQSTLAMTHLQAGTENTLLVDINRLERQHKELECLKQAQSLVKHLEWCLSKL